MHTLIRLLLRRKFAILAVLGVLLTATALALSVRESGQRAAAAREAQALVPVRAVQSLISLLERHRDLSSAYLSGGAGIANRHLEIEHEINVAFANTNVDIAMIENEAVNRIWSAVHRSWAEMPRALLMRSVSAQQSAEQHTTMIRELFRVIDRIADSHGLVLDSDIRAPDAGTASVQQRAALARIQ